MCSAPLNVRLYEPRLESSKGMATIGKASAVALGFDAAPNC